MSYEILFHPEAEKELSKLDKSIKLLVLKQIKKLEENPHLGKELGNKADLDLSGLYAMYVFKKKYRIVYSIEKQKIKVYIIAIGKRDDISVYKKASGRR